MVWESRYRFSAWRCVAEMSQFWLTALVMDVVRDFPPNIDAIRAAFPVRPGVIFTYGSRIYAPGQTEVPPALREHEAVHAERQGGDPAAWWREYIACPAFRLGEEVPAHRAEFLWHWRFGSRAPVKGFRSAVEFHRRAIALRLSGPLYGSLVSFKQAMELIEP